MNDKEVLSTVLFDALKAINGIMQNNEFCKDDKALVKANRFKKWLIEYAEKGGYFAAQDNY